MTSYVNPFTGQTISPSSVSYESITLNVNTALAWPINGNPAASTAISSILDIIATANGLSVALPPATQVSTGQSVLVRNIGSLPFLITDVSGNTIVTVTSGISEFIFLTDNTTVNGTWAAVVFGAGTSSANSSALAGYGLMANGLTLQTATPVVNYFSNSTLSAESRAQFSIWSSGVGTLTLPSAAAVGNNWYSIVRNSGTGILTIAVSGSDTIDGNSSQQLQLTESLVLVSNGITGFNTYAYGRSNQFAYTQFALSTTGGTITLSSTQAANTIQEYSGALTSNVIVIVPSTVQLYTFTNNTTGTYTFTIKTAVVGGSAVTIAQGTSLVLICDGTNVYNAASGGSSVPVGISVLTVDNGSAAAPSIKFTGDATGTGFFLNGTGSVGVTSAGSQVASFSSTGLTTVGVTAVTVTATSGIFGGQF